MLRPECAIISDNNVELINFYQTLAKQPTKVYRKFASIPRSPDTYYRVRSAASSERDAVTRSAMFLYLNRNCFNGIYRTSAKGEFNVPFSASRVPKYPSLEEVQEAAAALGSATIRCGDFEVICREVVTKGDLIYLDPPYYVASRRLFREYSSQPFCENDFRRLTDLLVDIDKRGARFVLSYPDCTLIRGLARRWHASRIRVMRSIAGKVSARGYARELLIRNY